MQNSSSTNIKHVVVLMFENRSFDHILGVMPGANGVLNSKGNLKEEIYNYLDPSDPNTAGNVQQVPFPITPGAPESAYITGNTDFNHELYVMFTDLCGEGTTGIINGEPQNNPWPVYPSVNCGFVQINNEQTGGGNYPYQYPIMSYFEWNSMKVFHQLASEFVVCDNWFCDMLGHTAPNRAFMHCATDGDMGLQNTDNAREPNASNGAMVNRESIFERLEKYGSTWKMYVPGTFLAGNNVDTCFLNNTVANQVFDPAQPEKPNCTEVPLSQFCADLNAHNLPTYSFIMCFDTNNDPSMHPNASVIPGENLLASVYNSLRNSPHWNDTLLVVNFDENGGIYDHVRPPRTVPPHPENPAKTVVVDGTTYTFDFSTLGFRIPAILISPWLRKGVESQQLQNTSVLRFLQDQFCVPQPPDKPLQSPVSYLTQRDRFANSIQAVFDDFGLPAPRTDCINNISQYSSNQWDICQSLSTPPETLQSPPKKYLADLTLEYMQPLPGHTDTGKYQARTFHTVADMISYVAERKQAAREYYGK